MLSRLARPWIAYVDLIMGISRRRFIGSYTRGSYSYNGDTYLDGFDMQTGRRFNEQIPVGLGAYVGTGSR